MTGFERAMVGGVAGLLYGAGLLIIPLATSHLDSRRCYIEEFDMRGRAVRQCGRRHEDLAGFDRSNVNPTSGSSPVLTLSTAPFGLLAVVHFWLGGNGWWREVIFLLGPPLLWAAIGSLVALSGRGKSLRLAQVLVVSHYVSAFALLALGATTGTGLRGLAGKVPNYVLVWATFYLAGQVVLWRRMISRGQVRRRE